MKAEPVKTVVVGGHTFSLATDIVGGILLVGCVAQDSRDLPWAAALSTAMGHPASLFEQIRAKGGEGWEGDVAYGYHDGEDEPPPGHVACYFFEEVSIVSEVDFESLARELALFALDSEAALGVPARDSTALRAIV